MSETFQQKQAAERLFGVLKDEDQKQTFNKTGFKRIKTQVFLALIDRF